MRVAFSATQTGVSFFRFPSIFLGIFYSVRLMLLHFATWLALIFIIFLAAWALILISFFSFLHVSYEPFPIAFFPSIAFFSTPAFVAIIDFFLLQSRTIIAFVAFPPEFSDSSLLFISVFSVHFISALLTSFWFLQTAFTERFFTPPAFLKPIVRELSLLLLPGGASITVPFYAFLLFPSEVTFFSHCFF